jgi:hypothetical protein
MQIYKDLGGNSSILAYEIRSNSIWIKFKDGSNYLFTYESAGMVKVRMMQFLASAGVGLNAFIKRYANRDYAVKSRE